MKCFCFLVVAFCCLENSHAQVLNTFQIGNIGSDKATCVAIDHGNNYYLGLTYADDVDASPGGSFDSLSDGCQSFSNSVNAGLISLDKNGNFRWKLQPQLLDCNAATNTINCISVDSSNHIWVLGSARGFNTSVDIDPSAGVLMIGTSNQSQDNGFLWRLDSSGNVLGVFSFPDINNNSIFRPHSIALSPQGDVVIAGSFSDSFDADPGPGVTMLYSAGGVIGDDFFIRLDSTGNFISAFSLGSTDNEEEPVVAFDHTGNVYMAGPFYNTIDFDPGLGIFNLTAPSYMYGSGAFILKMDTADNFVWAKSVAGSSTVDALGIIFQDDNGPVLFGYYNGMADFNPGAGISYHTSQSLTDVYRLRLDTNGNFKSFHSLPKVVFGVHPGICPLPSGEMVFYGSTLYDLPDVDPGPGIFTLLTHGTTDMFAMAVDSAFEMKWVKKYGGTLQESINGVATNGNGYYLFGGTFKSNNIVVQNTPMSSIGLEDACFSTFFSADNRITGKIFYDFNTDQNFNYSDVAVQFPVFRFNADTLIPGVTPQTAKYRLYMSDTGTANIAYLNPPAYYTINTNQINIPFGQQQNQVDSLHDFILSPISGITDFYTHLDGLNGLQIGNESDYYIKVSNKGTTTCGGTLVLHFDSALTLVSADSIPLSVSADSIVWNVSSESPLHNYSTRVKLQMSSQPSYLGDTLFLYAVFYPALSDSTPVDNYDTLIQIATGSYDPNLKETREPERLDSSYNHHPEFITYTIHFQNTGTANTHLVIVRDSINFHFLDLSSFEFLQSSYPCSISLNPAGELIFVFNGIVLTPDNISDVTSRGFVSFRIKTNSVFTFNDTIRNKSSIYFDSNSSVVTNETRNYIYTPPNISGTNDSHLPDVLSIYPNPVTDQLNLVFNSSIGGPVLIEIIDVLGRVIVMEKKTTRQTGEQNFQLNVRDVTNGSYVLLVKTGNDVITKRIVINH